MMRQGKDWVIKPFTASLSVQFTSTATASVRSNLRLGLGSGLGTENSYEGSCEVSYDLSEEAAQLRQHGERRAHSLWG